VTVEVIENARERDHADVRARPHTVRAEKSSRETATRQAATTGSVRERTDMLEETVVEEAASGTEETAVLTEEESAVTTPAEPESVPIVVLLAAAVTCSTIAEVALGVAVTATADVLLSSRSSRPTKEGAVLLPRESPRSLRPT
jgi:hypothetical protein